MLASSFRFHEFQDLSQLELQITGTFILKVISFPLDQERARVQLLRLVISGQLLLLGFRRSFGVVRLLGFGLVLTFVKLGLLNFSHECAGFTDSSRLSLISLISLLFGLVAFSLIGCDALVVVKGVVSRVLQVVEVGTDFFGFRSEQIEEVVHSVHVCVCGHHPLRLDSLPFLVKALKDGQDCVQSNSLFYGCKRVLVFRVEVHGVGLPPGLFIVRFSSLSQPLRR